MSGCECMQVSVRASVRACECESVRVRVRASASACECKRSVSACEIVRILICAGVCLCAHSRVCTRKYVRMPVCVNTSESAFECDCV